MIFRLPDENIIEIRGLYAVTRLRQIYRIVMFDLKTNEFVLYTEDDDTIHVYIKGE